MSVVDLYKVCDARLNLVIRESDGTYLMFGSVDDIPVGMLKRNIKYVTTSVSADFEIILE